MGGEAEVEAMACRGAEAQHSLGDFCTPSRVLPKRTLGRPMPQSLASASCFGRRASHTHLALKLQALALVGRGKKTPQWHATRRDAIAELHSVRGIVALEELLGSSLTQQVVALGVSLPSKDFPFAQRPWPEQ